MILESKHILPKNILYSLLIAVTGAFFLISSTIPIIYNNLEDAILEIESVMKIIKIDGDKAWKDVMEMKQKISPSKLLERRQAGYEQSINNYYEIIDRAPTYGYGYTKLKCCCSIPGLSNSQPATSYTTSSKCPVGEKGERGDIGESGDNGIPGEPGMNGFDYPLSAIQSERFMRPKTNYGYGIESAFNGYLAEVIIEQNCERCPEGKRGLPGPKGSPGPRGVNGVQGKPGKHGKHGKYGIQGSTGNPGLRGNPGQQGTPGQRGLDGWRKTVGPRGSKGIMGAPGIAGIRGMDGPSGNIGRSGNSGNPGRRGVKGQDGMQGMPGAQGESGMPGADQFYCECEKRTNSFEYETPARIIELTRTTEVPSNYQQGSLYNEAYTPSTDVDNSDAYYNHHLPSPPSMSSNMPSIIPPLYESAKRKPSYPAQLSGTRNLDEFSKDNFNEIAADITVSEAFMAPKSSAPYIQDITSHNTKRGVIDNNLFFTRMANAKKAKRYVAGVAS
uniref:Col_cuticle_N domain-containing protein n=1 Tax=Rhabditophanes sp. KR3021 TaxID=114890 RepID=A0AC35U7B5_9BILA